jgi:diguanylate cyclase (GGDEF)-like protein/PAS domain S-box-containing protein
MNLTDGPNNATPDVRAGRDIGAPRSDAEFSSLLGNLPGVAYRCVNGTGWSMRMFGAGCVELTGHAAGDLDGEGGAGFLSLIVEEDREQRWRAVLTLASEGSSYGLEYRIRDRHGRIKTVWERGHGVRDEQGNLVALEGLIWDISDRKRAEKLQTIAHRITDAAYRSLGLHDLFGHIRDELGAIIDTKNIYIALYHRTGQLLSFPYYIDENYPSGARVPSRPFGRGLSEYVIRTGRPLMADSRAIQALADAGEIEILGPLPMMWLGAPLRTESRVVGVIAVQSYSSPTVYNENDLEFLEFVSGQIATVIERKRAEEALKTRALQQETVATLGRLALAGKTLDELLAAVIPLLAESLGVECCAVLQLLGEGKALVRAGSGWPEGVVGSAIVDAGPGSQVGYALRCGQTVVIEDLGTEKRFAVPDLLRKSGMVRGLNAAIHGVDRPFGVLEAYSARRRQFTRDDEYFAEAIANVLAEVLVRKHTEAALRESEQRFRQAFEEAAIGKAIAALDGRYLKVNRSLCEMFGYSEAELLSRTLQSITHPDDLDKQMKEYDRLLGGAIAAYRLEKRYLHKEGRVVWVQVTAAMVRDDVGNPLYTVAEIQDITERKGFETQMVYLANHDPLTSLYNRRRFQEELEHQLALARRYEARGGALLLDLDQFKEVNDTLGHQAGDQLLKTLAKALRERLRETDTLARIGGDEFAVLLPHADAERAAVVAGHVLETVARCSVDAGGQHAMGVTTSIGVVLFPEHGRTSDELIARADAAMYEAKRNGGNRFVFFQPDDGRESRIVSVRAWERRIREALDNGLFTICGQPILDLRTGEIDRYELLLRLRGQDRELIPPAVFLDVAERSGLVRCIDRWMVREAISLLREHAHRGRMMSLEVNLSGRALSDVELMPLIRDELTLSGIDPGRLVLEITETASMVSLAEARTFVETLRGLGCKFALDDFGTGYSSFAYLKHFPVDYLKIDGSFVENLTRDPIDRHLVEAIVATARGLGKETIAEFVSDAETVAVLKECGVDYAQGFHIGRPLPLAELWPDLIPYLDVARLVLSDTGPACGTEAGRSRPEG